MFKKMMLLAVAVAALVAFAVPAVAHANPVWNGEEIEGHGELTSVSATGVVTGPAPITFSATVEDGKSTGSITSFVINEGKGGVATNKGNCTATGSVSGLPWTVHLTTPDTMTITGVRFTNTYTGSECASQGVPGSVSATGNVTLTITGAQSADADPYNDATAPTLTVFNPATNLHVLVGGNPIGVDIQGDVTWSGASIE